MRYLPILAVLALAAMPTAAQTVAPTAAAETVTAAGFAPIPADGVDLDAFLWLKRPVVVFANTPADPAFREQMDLLADLWPELAARDVVVVVDTDPAAMTAVRRKLRPRGFMLVVMDKDGSVALRKPSPWNVREISRTIDKMPSRREEMRTILPGR